MSKPLECATTLFLNLRSILVGHFGLQSVSYRVETPCMYQDLVHRKCCPPPLIQAEIVEV